MRGLDKNCMGREQDTYVHTYGRTLRILDQISRFGERKRKKSKCHLSGVKCHVSHVKCHMSLTPTATTTDRPTANSLSMRSRMLLLILLDLDSSIMSCQYLRISFFPPSKFCPFPSQNNKFCYVLSLLFQKESFIIDGFRR